MSYNTLYLLDLLALCVFGLSYYRNCFRKGYSLDFWHTQLIVACVLPYMLMLPAATNPLNALIVGADLAGVIAATPVVFTIVLVGYFFALLGAGLWKVRLGVGLRGFTARALDVLPRCSMMLMSSQQLILSLCGICFSLQMLVLSLYFRDQGLGFDLRAYTFENPGIRPMAQIAAISSTIMIGHSIARYIERREKPVLLAALALILGLFFFGQRGNIVGSLINVSICYVIQRRRRLSLTRTLSIGLSALILVLYLGSVRAGDYSPLAFARSLAFFFFLGNNLSDLRDFSWIYSRWDHHFWLGKTYVAGLATFVPRSLSDFRGEWTFGVATGRIVGLDTETHPGLRPGQFGECYFNFGVVGVAVFGLLLGVIVKRIDVCAKEALAGDRPEMMRAFSYTSLFSLSAFLNTSLSLTNLYAFAGLCLAGWLFLKTRALVSPGYMSEAVNS